jgi:MFS family permease
LSAPTALADPTKPPVETRALSWDAFLSTYLPALVLAMGTGIALPAIPVLAKSFEVSFGLASGVITAFLLGGMVGSLPTGWLIDRIGRRKVMLAGPILTAVVAVLVLTARSFPELLVYRFFDGWAANMWLMARLAAISDRASAGQRGRQVSWMFGMDNVGRLAGPAAGGFIAAAWGVRSPFGAYAVLALLAFIPTFKYADDSPPRAAHPEGVPERTRPSVRQLVVPQLALFSVAFFAAAARAPLFADLLHLYAAFAYNLTAQGVGFLATGTNALSLPIGFLAGWMLDRIGRKMTIVPGFAGVVVSMLLLAMTAWLHMSLTWYVVVFMMAVATQSLTGGSIQTIGADVAPAQARGMFLGLWRFAGQVGTAFSPIAFAAIAEGAGYGAAFVFVAAAALVVTVLLITRVPETSKRPLPQAA